MIIAVLSLICLAGLTVGGLLLVVYLVVDTRNVIGLVRMPEVVVAEVIAVLELAPGDTLVDLGAGDGRVLVAAGRAVPGVRLIGYENNPVMALRPPRGVEWRRQDLLTANLTGVTHVVAYLHPRLNAQLADKLRELAPGSRVVTVQYELPGHTPVRVIEPAGSPSYAAKIFVYDV